MLIYVGLLLCGREEKDCGDTNTNKYEFLLFQGMRQTV